MRKHLSLLATLLAAFMMLCGCGSPVTGRSDPSDTSPSWVTEQNIVENLEKFLGVDEAHPDGTTGNRTPFSAAENRAAAWLTTHFGAQEYRDAGLEVVPYTTIEGETTRSRTQLTYKEKVYGGYNVELRLPNPKAIASGKQIIVGAGYGNMYGTPDDEDTHAMSTGAFEGGTSAATLMSLIDACVAHKSEWQAKTDFDLVFVFFCCSGYNDAGARTYVEHMTPTEALGTLCYIDIGALGGDRMYLYTGTQKTAHRDVWYAAADARGLRYYAYPDALPVISGEYYDDVYYTRFDMLGGHAPFYERNIPVLGVRSGYYGGVNLSELERKGKVNVRGTENDTYKTLLSERSAYARQGADTAALVQAALQAENFASAHEASRDVVVASFWTNPFWAHMIVLFVIIALAVVLIFVVRALEKKYPYQPQRRRMRVAVFGMEYEDTAQGDVFIDIKDKQDIDPFA